MNDILVYDEVIPKEDIQIYRDILLYRCPFFYGESDKAGKPPSGLVCDFEKIKLDKRFKTLLIDFINKIYEKDEKIKNMKLFRVYLNYFSPNDNPLFHIDGQHLVTCLYYLNPEYDLDEGGETQFILDDEIKGIRSKPGRLVIFDGSLKHRATSFKSHPRLTLAIKFYK